MARHVNSRMDGCFLKGADRTTNECRRGRSKKKKSEGKQAIVNTMTESAAENKGGDYTGVG